jgi:manganese-dependent inorganic pyrophosphatase
MDDLSYEKKVVRHKNLRFCIIDKEFDMDGMLIGIASVDASGLEHFEDMEECMQEVMAEYYEDSGLVHMFLMLNDYDRNLTELLYCGEGAEEVVQDAFALDEDDRVMIDHVASRKLDIVPLLTMAYQDLANAVWAVDEAA